MKNFILILISFFIIILNFGCIEKIEENQVLNIIYQDYKLEYTLDDIKSLESYTGTGGYIKSKLLPDSVIIENINSYTGVKLLTIFDEIPNFPENYKIIVFSSDGWSTNFTKKECLGYVDIYDYNGIIIPNQKAVMILAYKENGKYYTNDDQTGPLRIAFVDGDIVTSSNLWSKMVLSIEIILL